MFDQTPSELARLEPQTRAIATSMVNYLRQHGYPAVIVRLGGRRNDAEQRHLVAHGFSRTMNSAHLDGRAFDLDMAGYARDDVPKELWYAIGQLAEQVGLRWGGRWGWDFGHFEVPKGWGDTW